MQSINEGIFGIDVSRWQGSIDWGKVKASGVQAAIIKAGGADDGIYEDSKLIDNYVGTKSVGIPVGAYFFFSNVENVQAQADYFAAQLNCRQWEIRPVIDVEMGKEDTALTAKVLAFAEFLETSTGMRPAIYCNTNYARNYLDNRLAKYPLWVAHYGVDTPGDNPIWQQWAGFQYSSDECIAGITENTVDKDRFTEAMFLNNVAAPQQTFAASPPPVQAPLQANNTYVVQGGDNLSSIAERFGTSWQALAEINNIANPDLILEGQVLSVTSCPQSQQQATPSQLEPVYYTIQEGDTLSDIASNYGVSWQDLANFNNIADPSMIYAGDTIRIR